MKRKGYQQGFALPVVLISSIAMMLLLVTSLSASSSIVSALKGQYYNKLAQEAAESALSMAEACLSNPSSQSAWMAGGWALAPNTNCSTGATIPGASRYVVDTPTIKTSYSIAAPTYVNGAYSVTVSTGIDKYGGVSGWKVGGTQQALHRTVLVVPPSFSSIAFGYYSINGAQFGVIMPNGEVKTLGENSDGRLGDGSTALRTTPVTFRLPLGQAGASVYSNLLSAGRAMFVITKDGQVYAAGYNAEGQLGVGDITSPSPYPRKVGTFGDSGKPKAVYVTPGTRSSFIIGSDNFVYGVGANGLAATAYGMQGTCANNNTNLSPVGISTLNFAMALMSTTPAVSTPSNPSLVVDADTQYIRMANGKVWGWGYGGRGQMANGASNVCNAPVEIAMRTIGSPSTINVSPVARQIATNGDNIYIVDDQGRAWVGGGGQYGQRMGAGTPLQISASTTASDVGKCLAVETATTYRLINATCNVADKQQYLEWWPDGTLRFRLDPTNASPAAASKCATRTLVSGTLYTISMMDCIAGASTQRFSGTSMPGATNIEGELRFVGGANECATGFFGVILLGSCSSTTLKLKGLNTPYLRPIPQPKRTYDSTYAKYERVSADFMSTVLLDDDGNAWGAGWNTAGQLGSGSVATYEPMLKKVAMPAGAGRIIDVYNTGISPMTGAETYQNTFFLMQNGSIYGAGANTYGQLGNGAPIGSNGTSGPAIVSSPVKMSLPPGAKASSVQAGYGTTVVLTTKGVVYTVGNNATGQLGTGDQKNSSTPAANKYTNVANSVNY